MQIFGANAVLYGMGSLYTSICPSLVLQGVGEAVAASAAPKILILNGSHDRETLRCVSHGQPMRASDVAQAVRAAKFVCFCLFLGLDLCLRCSVAVAACVAVGKQAGAHLAICG